jgi:hypothetical protein
MHPGPGLLPAKWLPARSASAPAARTPAAVQGLKLWHPGCTPVMTRPSKTMQWFRGLHGGMQLHWLLGPGGESGPMKCLLLAAVDLLQ